MSLFSTLSQYRYSIPLALFGMIGLLAAFMVSLDTLYLAANPDYVPPCSVNSFVSCTPVMQSSYATMFGFPNPWIGLMGWPLSIFFALYLGSHRTYSKTFVWVCWIPVAAAVILSYIWLFITFFLIEAICLWYVLSALMTTLYFSLFTHFLHREGFWGNLPLKTSRDWILFEILWIGLWIGLMYVGVFM